MTSHEHDEQLDPLSPADEERISALLADARATEPMPADVVTRLGQTLAGLAEERVAIDPVRADNVVPIARTRRHRVVAVLGAAAAVVVFGLAVGSFFDQSGDDAGSADAGAESADSDFQRGSVDDQADASGDDFEEAAPQSTSREGNGVIVADRAYVVRSRHLSRDLARIQGRVLRDPNAAPYSQFLVHAPEGFACRTAAWGEGILVGVRYDGDPAFVAFRAPMGDAQVVDVLQCGTGDLLRTTTLPTDG